MGDQSMAWAGIGLEAGRGEAAPRARGDGGGGGRRRWRRPVLRTAGRGRLALVKMGKPSALLTAARAGQ